MKEEQTPGAVQISATAAREALAETFTPERAAELATACKQAAEVMTRFFREFAAWAADALRKVSQTATKSVNDFTNGLLYHANEHPKWWHYYKHSKKLRTRRKYRKLLMRQLLRKMAAGSL